MFARENCTKFEQDLLNYHIEKILSKVIQGSFQRKRNDFCVHVFVHAKSLSQVETIFGSMMKKPGFHDLKHSVARTIGLLRRFSYQYWQIVLWNFRVLTFINPAAECWIPLYDATLLSWQYGNIRPRCKRPVLEVLCRPILPVWSFFSRLVVSSHLVIFGSLVVFQSTLIAIKRLD